MTALPAEAVPGPGPGCYFDKGRIIDTYNFTAEDLTVVGIARCLSRINRFAGNGAFTVSVAQHSVALSYAVPRKLRKAALLHDLPEGLGLGDMLTPVKRICPGYDEIEQRMLRRVAEVFKIPYTHFLELRPFDSQIGRDEARAIFSEPSRPVEGGLGVEIVPMSAKEAEDEFVRRFFELFMEPDDVE